MNAIIHQLHLGSVQAHSPTFQPTSNPVRGLTAAELGLYASRELLRVASFE